MAEVMKFEDFKAEGSEAACKVINTLTFTSYFADFNLNLGRWKVPPAGPRLCGWRRRHHLLQIQRRRRTHRGKEEIKHRERQII